jgi:2-keto-4-pentenoate hydratase/2-oxohepta-3-ene-1,7-dioic acid hydratase in catechol pathway
VSEGEALDYVAGYGVHNDYSEREFQLEHGGQWVKGKSADTFAPFGPYLVTKEEVADVHALDLWLSVNGERRQNSNTKNLIFGVPFLVSYLSRFMTLLPGDMISTGTPGGVGMGSKPQVFLRPGDVCTLSVAGLGQQEQKAVAHPGNA